MAVDQQFHRPGPLKQSNKSHKTGRHRSKGAIDKALKGKVSLSITSHKHKQQQRREQRRNQSNQIRKNKREEAIAIKRQIGGINTTPFLICILPLHLQIDPKSVLAILENCDAGAVVNKTLNEITYITIPKFKQRFSFIIPPIGPGTELQILDYLKVCDTTLFVTSAAMGEDDIIDRWGHKIFNMISAQGIPTPVVTIMDLESINPKRKQSAKTAVQKFITKLLPEEKIIQLDTNTDGLNVLRKIGGQKKNILYNKANRPHMFAEKITYKLNTDKSDETGTLSVSGYLRGIPLDVNGLVHIPGLGDFQMKQIEAHADPYKLDKNEPATSSNITETRIVAKVDPTKQVSLQKENIPDAMDAEQTWPTEEEIQIANEETKNSKKKIKRIPKGMSEYQACWIPDVEETNDEETDTDDSEKNEFMSCTSEEDSEAEMVDAQSEIEDQCDSVTVSEGPVSDEKYDLAMDLQEERETMNKIKEARVDQLFPDEIDTPLDVPARERFQKYRGLESFRTSPWDVKENLPSDFARIYQFKNFERTKRRIIQETADIDGVMPGWYITIHIVNVPATAWNSYNSSKVDKENLILYGILPHEHQMSVVNVILKRIPDSEIPLKSKEKLIVQCGYRRFVINPIFSQHTNGDKHKYERFFRPHTTVVATFYAPIQFPPAPVLCFKENPNSTLALVARGCLLSCNPDRVVLKRVVLSGHPMRINRKSATIRYMLFNKQDVDYFKPIKLRTKCGRLGHIKESLGTHGHMKCIFDGQLKSYDTVFLYLYKRVFPKWTYEECIVSCENQDFNNQMQE